jgi:hypothetical protein
MNYWRMQLHPADPQRAGFHAAQSLCAGFIGLDFEQDEGDLMRATRQNLPAKHRDYWGFAHDMTIGDKVLIILHHFPFAVATVDGDYNYIRQPVPEIGVWFRHFRRVKDVQFYSDRVTNAGKWEQLKMTDTLARLQDTQSQSYQIIDSW